MEKLFRALEAHEIGVYVTEVIDNLGAKLALYVPKEVIINLMNESFGLTGWKKEDRFITGASTMEKQSAYICSLAVKTDDGWVSREARGTVSSQEDEDKNEEINAFKRASYMWGVGKELRLLPPQLYFPEGKFQTLDSPVPHVSKKTSDTFVVDKVTYEGQKTDACHISGIVIRDTTTGETVSWKVTNGVAEIVDSLGDTAPKKGRGRKKKGVEPESTPETESSAEDASSRVTDELVSTVIAKVTESVAEETSKTASKNIDYKNVMVHGFKARGQERTLGEMLPYEVAFVLGKTNDPVVRDACILYAKDDDKINEQVHVMAETTPALAAICRDYQL